MKHTAIVPPVLLTSCLLLGAAVADVSAQASNWPAFRGTNTAGVSSTAVPTSWDLASSRNVAWKTPIPGLAHSSPIVWGDRVYVTTAVAASGRPSIKTGDVDKSGIDSATDTGSHTWRLIALDRQSGKIVWDRAVHQGVPRMKRHVKASHASATPATDGRVIVALLGQRRAVLLRHERHAADGGPTSA